jgi:chemotaxis-related protein WspD
MSAPMIVTAHGKSLPVVHDCWNRIGVRGDRSCPELTRHTHCRNCETYAAAATALLDRDLPSEHRSESTAHYAGARQTLQRNTVSAIVFRIGAEWLALPTLLLHEVADKRPVHPLPARRAGAAAGIVNVRGDLVTHVSLAELLEIEATEPDAPALTRAMPRLLVVGDGVRRLAFDVNEVAEVRRYAPAELRPIPSTLARARVVFTVGLLAMDQRTIGCLDGEHTLRALSSRLG